jgi:hypothetical protein
MELEELVERYGQLYSEALGINLQGGAKEEVTKWFLAALLYGKPIRESAATKTYRVFESRGVVTPERILKTGWHSLVALLDEGGYTRYDFSTADKLLRVFQTLEREYAGDLNFLHERASDSVDLERRLKALGKGIGDVTVSIFLRDLRGVWAKAKPKPTPLVENAMKRLGISDIESTAARHHLSPTRLETALLRLEKNVIKRNLGSK